MPECGARHPRVAQTYRSTLFQRFRDLQAVLGSRNLPSVTDAKIKSALDGSRRLG
jgi:hypothetical protein